MKEIEKQLETKKLSLLEFEELGKDRREKIDSLLSNTDYFGWLVEFTKRYPRFSYYTKDAFLRTVIPANTFNNDWDDVDRKNVEMLCLFYDGIQEYADLHHLGTNVLLKLDFEYYYLVKLSGICFKITYTSKINKYSCEMVTDYEEKDAIDLTMIIDSKNNEKYLKVKKFHKIMDNYCANLTESLTLQEIFERVNEKDFFSDLSIDEIQLLIDDTDEKSKLRFIFENIKKQKELEKETQESINTLKLKK